MNSKNERTTLTNDCCGDQQLGQSVLSGLSWVSRVSAGSSPQRADKLWTEVSGMVRGARDRKTQRWSRCSCEDGTERVPWSKTGAGTFQRAIK